MTEAPTELDRISRTRLAAGSMLLLGLAMVQDAGLLIADTKLDLAVDPGGFLSRAAHLWDAGSALGQLQNQAYGYAWPMGSFFWVADQAGVPDWATQRLWIGLVMVMAFIGCALVSRALGIRSELACLVAGAAYATSPRLLSILGGVSIEAWPSAVAPWVLLPLVTGVAIGSPRRAAALSALAVGLIGGVNAAASASALPLGVVWLLTRDPGPRRRAMMLWWPLFTFMATAWWLIPLFVLGAYSPPFLDWIESAAVTTFPTTPFDALRGTSAWIPYVDNGWAAGNALLREFHLILNSTILLTLGVLGLASRRNPHRTFLGLSLAVGMLLVSFGHTGAVQGWFAEPSRDLLDAALAPLRNVHKFDPVVRLPLVLGLAWWLDAVLRRHETAPASQPGRTEAAAPRRSVHLTNLLSRQVPRATAVFVTLLAVATTASPMLLGKLANAGSFESVPDYWDEAAAWLADQPDQGTALLVPGSSFGTYVWGRPRDEPLQSLAETPWAVRNAVPLAPAGSIRVLDAIEERLAQGRGSAGLTSFMTRAGVRYLVVRNDLVRSNDIPDPVLVHQVLESSPGITKVMQFGPPVGGSPLTTVRGRRILVNGGWQAYYPAVEIYSVSSAGPSGSPNTASSTPTTVIGGPEDLLDLADLGLLSSGPTVLGVDADEKEPLPGGLVLTDGLRARERFFGRLHDTQSEVLLPGQPRRTANPVRDYLLTPEQDRWSTVADATGGLVEASSSQADADAPGGAQPGYLPWAAVDSDSRSSFRSVGNDPDPWWRLSLPEPRAVTTVGMQAGSSAEAEQRVQVRTEDGVVATLFLRSGERLTVPLSTPSTSWVEIRMAGGQARVLDLAEVTVPGVDPARWMRTPVSPADWGVPDAIVLRAALDHRTGCARLAGEVRCSPEQQEYPSEEPGALRRIVTLPESAEYPARVMVRPDPRRTSGLIQDGQLVRVTASSTQYDHPMASAVAVADRRQASTWVADDLDTRPSLAVDLLETRRISGVTLRLSPTVPAQAPTRVRVSWDGDSEVVDLDAEGRGALTRPVRTSSVEVEVLAADDAISLGFDGIGRDLPIGVSVLRIAGVPELPLKLTRLPLARGCGSGPTLLVDDRAVQTQVVASPIAILLGEPLDAELCTESLVQLDAGETRVELTASGDFLPVALVLGESPGAEGIGTVTTARTGPVSRELTGAEPNELIALAENSNPGWVAEQGGQQLEPVVIDGWRQGWQSVSSAPVEATFRPDQIYRVGLLVGSLLGLLLVAIVVISGRWDPSAPKVGSRTLSWPVTAALGVLAAGLLGSWVAAVVVGTLVVPVAASTSLRREVVALVTALMVAVAGASYAWRPWGASDGWAGSLTWPGTLVVVAVGLVVVATGSGLASRPRSRSAGSSTAR